MIKKIDRINLFIAIITLLFVQNLQAQTPAISKKPTSPKATNSKPPELGIIIQSTIPGDTVYTDTDNTIQIAFVPYNLTNVNVICSNGVIAKLNPGSTMVNGIYTLNNLTPGTTTVIIQQTIDGHFKTIKEKSFKVVATTKAKNTSIDKKQAVIPAITIEGYANGEIPLSIIKRAGKVELNIVAKSLEYNIVFKFASEKNEVVKFVNSHAAAFNKEIKDYIEKLNPGDSIILDEVKYTTATGTIKRIPSVVMNVTDNGSL